MDSPSFPFFTSTIPISVRSTGADCGFPRFKPGVNLGLLLILASVSLMSVLASSFRILPIQRQELLHCTQTATIRPNNTIQASPARGRGAARASSSCQGAGERFG